VVNGGVPAKIGFKTPALSTVGSACSAQVIVQTIDANDNPTNALGNETVNLSGDSGTITFYSDAICTNVIGSVQIGIGTTETSFFYKDTTLGTTRITAAHAGLTDGTQDHSIVVGTPIKVAVVTGAQTIAINTCSGVTTVQSQDAGSAASNVGSDELVNLTSTSGTMVLYSDAACTGGNEITSVTITNGNHSGE